MGFIQEFKDFAMRGNVMDMAVGIIIGGAFGKIVSSLVSDVIMPVTAVASGGVKFEENKLVLKEAAEGVEAITLNWGVFTDTVINFVIVAFAIFMMIKLMNSMQKKEEEAPKAPPEPSKEEKLLGEIRDLLAKKA